MNLPIALAGAAGRMGQEVLQAIAATDDLQLTQALVSAQSNSAGARLPQPQFGEMCYTRSLDPHAGARVLIVFALPDASLQYLAQARSIGLATVMCSTGFTSEQLRQCHQAAADLPLMLAPNTSIGIAWLARLATQLAKGLPDADIEILESHHNQKVDSPSGTALRLGNAVADARNVSLETHAAIDRSGKRQPGSIGFATLRLGTVVGEHSVLFGLDGETLALRHSSIGRQTFALGSIRLARWLVNQPTGLYQVEQAIEGF